MSSRPPRQTPRNNPGSRGFRIRADTASWATAGTGESLRDSLAILVLASMAPQAKTVQSPTRMLHTSMAGVHVASSPGLGGEDTLMGVAEGAFCGCEGGGARSSPTWPETGETTPPPGWTPGRPTSRLGYPDMDGVKSDLEGFDMIGRIVPEPHRPSGGRPAESLLRKLAWAECMGRARHRRDGRGDVSLAANFHGFDCLGRYVGSAGPTRRNGPALGP